MAKILLVDDEAEIIEMIENQLISMGHEVTSTNSPIRALEILGNHLNQYDLVLCDVIMPSKNGIDFVREVRRLPWFEGRIALMSSYTDALAQEFKDVGVTSVLRKPFNISKLVHFFEEAWSNEVIV